MIKFYSVTTLPIELRQQIREEMCYNNGAMETALKYNLPKQRLALHFKGQELVCWAIMSFVNWARDEDPYVGAWTKTQYRRMGYAAMTIEDLLIRLRIPKETKINVYSSTTKRIISGLGHNPVLRSFDGDWMRQWAAEYKSEKLLSKLSARQLRIGG